MAEHMCALDQSLRRLQQWLVRRRHLREPRFEGATRDHRSDSDALRLLVSLNLSRFAFQATSGLISRFDPLAR